MTPAEITDLLLRREGAEQQVNAAKDQVERCANTLAVTAHLPLAFRGFQVAVLREHLLALDGAVADLEEVLARTAPVFAEFKARID